LSGRASLTLHSRHSSTNNPLAPAGVAEVCANVVECPNALRKSPFRRPELVIPLPLLPWQSPIRTLSGVREASPEVPGVIQHPYLPHPPQTRAASFKRPYPK
jgi:hypothetical protein